MLPLQLIRSPRRGIFNLFKASTTANRLSSSKGEPFILPRIAIDLDAPDNPVVRDYDEERDNVLPQIQVQIEKENTKALAMKRRIGMIQTKDTSVSEREPGEITALDLMEYALLGKIFGVESGRDRLQKIFQENAVNFKDTAHVTIQKLTENYRTNSTAQQSKSQ